MKHVVNIIEMNNQQDGEIALVEAHQIRWEGIPGIRPSKKDERMKQWETLNYGMFIHWGLYSEIAGVWNDEPVTKGYSEQIQMWANISEEEYLDVAKRFTAEQFDADEICLLAKKAGMKYVLMTTKHHDGFCMFDTKTTNYNIVEQTPFGKDPLKMLSDACARHGLKFGIYYSLVDWHQGHPFDENNNNPIPENIEKIIEAQLGELLTNYGDICEIWFDMSSPTEAQSRKFIDIVRKYQPSAAINSRIWNNMGDFRTLDDNEVPSVTLDGSWQTPASIYQETWGYRAWQVRDDLQHKVKELLKALVGDGNYLLNIGPRGDGSIVPFEAEALEEIGAWLKRHPNMENVQATLFDKHPWGKVKANHGKVYLIVEDIPEDGQLILDGLLNKVNNVVEDGTNKEIKWQQTDGIVTITLPTAFEEHILPVIEVDIEGTLSIIPNHTVNISDHQTTIHREQFYTGHGYHELGNYNSMRQVIVRYTAFITANASQTVNMSFHGEVNEDKMYRVAVGNTEVVIKGKQLNEGEIGSFTISGDKVEEVSITLAEPTHEGDPLDITLNNMTIDVQ